MSILKISGDTLITMDWDVEEILESKENQITRLVDLEWFDKMSYCGLTYGEINQLENFNN